MLFCWMYSLLRCSGRLRVVPPWLTQGHWALHVPQRWVNASDVQGSLMLEVVSALGHGFADAWNQLFTLPFVHQIGVTSAHGERVMDAWSHLCIMMVLL